MSHHLVVRTKLVLPKAKLRTLHRTRPLAVLAKNLDKKLILLCSDAGYGKTTLLAQLCVSLKRKKYLYYSITPADNDLTTFIQYIITGIAQLYKGFGDMTMSIVEQTQDHEIIMGTFINEFFGLIHDEFYMVLDDYHHLHLNERIKAAMEYLLRHLPHNLHLIIASRATPPFDLSYYLTKQELCIMDKALLRFDREEIQKLLEKAYDMRIPKEEIERVEIHSEGWITAIQLILQKIALSGEPAKRTLNGFIASGEDLFEYFAREVFEQQPVKIRNFLLRTSFFDHCTPKMCNRVFQIRTSGSILNKLENDHLFITRTAKGLYFYHPLFRRFMQDLALKTMPFSEIKRIHATAGRYLAESDRVESAIDMYIKGTLYKKAIVLLKKSGDEYVQSCRFNLLLRWIKQLPSDLAAADSTLQNLHATVLWHILQIDDALKIYDRIIQRSKRKKDARNLLKALYGAARIYTNRGDFDQVLRYLKKCHMIKGIPRIELVDIYNLEGICYVFLNEFKKAEQRFEKAAAILKTRGGITRSVSLMNNLAIVAFTKGELEQSVAMFRKLVKHSMNKLAEAHIYANIALALIDLGHMDEAAASLRDAFRMSRRFMNTRAFHQFLLALGFYHIEKNNFTRAALYFKKVLKLTEAAQERLSEQKARHGLLKTHYLSRNTKAAWVVLEEMLRKDMTVQGIRNHDGLLLKGLIELQAGKIEIAEKTLLDALSIVHNTDFKYSLSKNLYHCAYLYFKKNDHEKTRDYLEQALQMAKEKHYDYFLIRQARYDIALLEYAVQNDIVAHYAGTILQSLIETSQLEIKLLGNFQVTVRGVEIDPALWKTKKAQSMFAYIMMHRHQPIAKEKLMEIFSTQEKPSFADQDIRTTISRVQKALQWRHLIAYKRGFYRVHDQVRVKIDAEEFERSIEHIVAHKGTWDNDIVRTVKRTIDMYDDFLISFYDQWSDTMRHYYQEKYLMLLSQYGRYLIHKKDYEAALSVYHSVLDRNPVHEDAQKGVLNALLRMGKRNEAYAHYAAYRKKVYKDTGLDLPGLVDDYLNNP